jgi:hypothetical protein
MRREGDMFSVDDFQKLKSHLEAGASGLGFMLKPVGFFDQNPALDVAPGSSAHC